MFSKQPDSRKQKREAEENDINATGNDTKEDSTKDLIDTAIEEFLSVSKDLYKNSLHIIIIKFFNVLFKAKKNSQWNSLRAQPPVTVVRPDFRK